MTGVPGHGEGGRGEHRPAPAALRRASRTHWPAWKVAGWIIGELAVVGALVTALGWLLTRQ